MREQCGQGRLERGKRKGQRLGNPTQGGSAAGRRIIIGAIEKLMGIAEMLTISWLLYRIRRIFCVLKVEKLALVNC